MRLISQQIGKINKLTATHLGTGCKAYLFGSRLNDRSRGGDVDLLVETPTMVPRLTKARLKAALEQDLSLPVDLIVVSKLQPLSSFQALVRSQAIPLPDWRET
jgi:uncharacterized protein